MLLANGAMIKLMFVKCEIDPAGADGMPLGQ